MKRWIWRVSVAVTVASATVFAQAPRGEQASRRSKGIKHVPTRFCDGRRDDDGSND